MLEEGWLLLQIEDDWFSGGSSFWGYGLWLFNLLVNFFTLILLHLLLRKTLGQMVGHTYANKFRVLVTGVSYLFGIPILAAFCVFRILGIPFGLLLLAAFILSLWLGNCLAALLITHYLNSRNVQTWNFWTIILLSLAIVTIIDLLVLFPVLGTLGYLAIIAITYGITLIFLWDTQLWKYQLIQRPWKQKRNRYP